MTEPDQEALRHQMQKTSRSMVAAIKRQLIIESELPPLPDRDDPRYEAIRLLHLGSGFMSIDRHPVWGELRHGHRRPPTPGTLNT